MKRTARKRESPLREVQKIQLSERHKKIRFILMIVFVVVALTAFSMGVVKLLSKEEGWRDIESTSRAQTLAAQEFSFQYNLGAGDMGAAAEYKILSQAYTDATDFGYMLFSNEEFQDCNNVYYLNRHPNEPVKVDPTLYDALSLLEDSRYLYLAPIYEQYRGLFNCTDDSETVYFDPYESQEIQEYFRQVLAYAKNPQEIQVKFLGDSTVELQVSQAYQAFAQENGIQDYLDFFWLKNALILDYTAKSLKEAGYTLGTITSYDGFAVTLGPAGGLYSFNLFDRVGQTVYQAATVEYAAPISMVSFRNFKLGNMDQLRYYEFENGDTRNSYIDPEDGLCKAALNDLVGMSAGKSCTEVALALLPVVAADGFDEAKLRQTQEEGIQTLYCKNGEIISSNPGLIFKDLYAGDTIQYTVK